jgi:hypothetical protein
MQAHLTLKDLVLTVKENDIAASFEAYGYSNFLGQAFLLFYRRG